MIVHSSRHAVIHVMRNLGIKFIPIKVKDILRERLGDHIVITQDFKNFVISEILVCRCFSRCRFHRSAKLRKGLLLINTYSDGNKKRIASDDIHLSRSTIESRH